MTRKEEAELFKAVRIVGTAKEEDEVTKGFRHVT
jgi:hypothetical protein